MQSSFSAFLQLGFEHISDLQGYDHILFIVALCAVYKLSEWKKVAILVTAFTLGHSLTLALAALDIVRFPGAWIEFLIPVTILGTALFNVAGKQHEAAAKGIFNKKIRINYLFALIFGLVHGMGFSNFFRASALPGEENSLLSQLLAFNIGVELGQLMIVAFILLSAYIGMQLLRIQKREWNLFISGAAAGLALVMALERIPWIG
ncbi:MAG: HupE/UreJ family protein [Saprospiraceae bacterium]|nr:HupE/UreJ family protein [Saprospiraceae bacterium]MDP4997435.1 HupE/UreJ family protein [Saprospiraceae bacterium]